MESLWLVKSPSEQQVEKVEAGMQAEASQDDGEPADGIFLLKDPQNLDPVLGWRGEGQLKDREGGVQFFNMTSKRFLKIEFLS